MDWDCEKWQCEGLLQCSVYADWFFIIDEATQCQLIIIICNAIDILTLLHFQLHACRTHACNVLDRWYVARVMTQ